MDGIEEDEEAILELPAYIKKRCGGGSCSVPDPVNHPKHYTSHPSGVECIEIVKHMGFCLGNAIKYIWRASLKGNAVEDLKKAVFYINMEIQMIQEKENGQ